MAQSSNKIHESAHSAAHTAIVRMLFLWNKKEKTKIYGDAKTGHVYENRPDLKHICTIRLGSKNVIVLPAHDEFTKEISIKNLPDQRNMARLLYVIMFEGTATGGHND